MRRSLDSSSCLGPMWLRVVGRTTCSFRRCAFRASVHRGRDYAARLRAATVPQRMGSRSRSRRPDAQDRRQATLILHTPYSSQNHRHYRHVQVNHTPSTLRSPQMATSIVNKGEKRETPATTLSRHERGGNGKATSRRVPTLPPKAHLSSS